MSNQEELKDQTLDLPEEGSSVLGPSTIQAEKKTNQKRKNWIVGITLGLVLALLIGGSAWYLATNPDLFEEASSEEEITSFSLLSKENDTLSKVIISSANGESFSLERTDKEAWKLSDLKHYDQSIANTTGLATAVAKLAAQKVVVEQAEDLAPYGLDETSARKMDVFFSDNTSYSILLGSANHGKTGVYFKYPQEDQIYLSTSALLDYGKLEKPAFLSVELVAEWDYAADATLNKIILDGTRLDTPIVFEPVPEEEQNDLQASAVKMVSPFNGHVNSDLFRPFVELMFGINAEKVVTIHPTQEQLKEYGLDQPSSSLYLSYESSSEYLISLGKKDSDGNYYCTKSGLDLVFTINPATVAWCEWSALDLHTPLLYPVILSELDALTLETPEKTYHFDVTQSHIDNVNPTAVYEGKVVEHENFQKFYIVLITTRLSGAVTTPPKEEDLELTLTFGRPDKTADDIVVRFYTYGTRDVAVSVDGEKAQFTISRSYLDKYLSDLARLLRGEEIIADF